MGHVLWTVAEKTDKDFMRHELTFSTIVFVVIAMSVHGIFMFKREILFDKKKFKTLLIISFGLFGLYFLLKGLDIRERNMEVLQVPFLALIIFFLMSYLYGKIFGENPEDTFHSMDIALMKDGIFNALFWFIGLFVPIILVFKVFSW
jgi:uncharacterized membrane protein